MSFKILYHEGTDITANLFSMAVYVNSFAKSLGIEHLNVDSGAFQSVAAALIRPDFPHLDGIDKASPFKKAANFFVWFVAEKPIIDEIPCTIILDDSKKTLINLTKIQNHQNVIFAYHMAIDCLCGADLHKNGKVFVLKNKIKVSRHFFCDFVHAYSTATPLNDFKPVSLLFEQLAYKANPDAPYPETI